MGFASGTKFNLLALQHRVFLVRFVPTATPLLPLPLRQLPRPLLRLISPFPSPCHPESAADALFASLILSGT